MEATAKKTIGKVAAIKMFFEQGGGRPITMQEMRALTEADRTELGHACAAALGMEIA